MTIAQQQDASLSMLETQVSIVLLIGLLALGLYLDVALRPPPTLEDGAPQGMQDRRTYMEANRRWYRIPAAAFAGVLALVAYYSWRITRPLPPGLDPVADHFEILDVVSGQTGWAEGMLIVPLAGWALCLISMDTARLRFGPLPAQDDVHSAVRADRLACLFFGVLFIHLVYVLFMTGLG